MFRTDCIGAGEGMEVIVVVWVRGDVVKTDGSSRNGENCMGMK